jgi:NTE family protein
MTGTTVRTALVIGRGGLNCVAALGVKRALDGAGIELGRVVTSGAGGLFGALLALGSTDENTVRIARSIWTRKVLEEPNRLAFFQAMRSPTMAGGGFRLRGNRRLVRRIRDAVGAAGFEDTVIPLHVSATDFRSGEPMVFSDGSLFDALRSSFSVPTVYPVVEKDYAVPVSGSLADPLPVGVALQEGSDIILAMGFDSAPTGGTGDLTAYVLRLSEILTGNLVNASYAFCNLAHHSELLAVSPDIPEDIGPYDTDRIPEMIDAGEDAGRRLVPQLSQLLGESA